MAYDIPDDLLQLRRDFLASETRLAELSKGGDQGAWDEAYRESQRLAVEIDRNPYWATVDNRYKAWMALRDAAAP